MLSKDDSVFLVTELKKTVTKSSGSIRFFYLLFLPRPQLFSIKKFIEKKSKKYSVNSMVGLEDLSE
jgi:hypothetical protein